MTGDDRGGIAVSTASVFYTGDSATGRFALDLSSPMSTGFQYDALTSNLRTGQVYSLGTGSTPIPNSGGTVTTLIALDGTTSVPTGAVVTLSTSITVAYGRASSRAGTAWCCTRVRTCIRSRCPRAR
nr:hypothetical protein [Deltaproteobacteria bacterium]